MDGSVIKTPGCSSRGLRSILSIHMAAYNCLSIPNSRGADTLTQTYIQIKHYININL